MPDKRIAVMDVYELLRRRHNDQTISEISRAMDRARKTIRAYLAQAQEAGVDICGPLPPKEKVMAVLAESIGPNLKGINSSLICKRFTR